MSTLISSLLGDYTRAVAQFQLASGGSYAGPSMPLDMLGDIVGAADGLQAADLIDHTKAAVGSSRPDGGGSGLMDFLGQAVTFIGGGAMEQRMQQVQDDHDQDRAEATHLAESAENCSAAITEVVGVSESALSEVLSAALPLLNILTMVLTKHPLGRFIAPVIATIGADLIEQTNFNIVGTCRDRDDTIDSCYEEFERRCEEVCCRELPPAAPEPAAACPPADVPSTQPSPPATEKEQDCPPAEQPQDCPPAEPPVDTEATTCPPEPPAKQQVPPPRPAPVVEAPPAQEPCPEPAPRPEAPPQPTASEVEECEVGTVTAQAPAPVEPAPPEPHVATPPEPAPQPEPAPCPEPGAAPCPEPGAVTQPQPQPTADCEPHSSCCGCLGQVGAGIAILGLGALVAAAVECIEQTPPVEEFVPEPPPAPEPCPEPAPAPEPVEQPCPEPPPAPEPQVEPAPEPPPAPGEVIAPPPELAEVEEPAPPPKKVEMMAADAETTPAPAPEAPPVPAPAAEAPAPVPAVDAPAPEPPPEQAPAAETEPESEPRARKAGQW